jgi:penicillin-binding protein 2
MSWPRKLRKWESLEQQTFENREEVVVRLWGLKFLTLFIFFVFGARLWWLQVASYQEYAQLAEQNRIRELPLPAPRGRIFDRKGKLLVDSRPVFNLVISHKDVKSVRDEIELLVTNLGIERAWLEQRLEEAKYEPKYEYIVIKERATPSDVAWVAAHEYDHPELRIEAAPQRHYLYGSLAAHVLGYVGEVSRRELNGGRFSRDKGFKLGDIVGKSGVEYTYNDMLTGQDGKRLVLVDSRGRLKVELERIEPVPGRDLYATLDYELQATAEAQGDAMPRGRGAIAVLDPQNGEVRALVSRPAFDPNVFSQRARTPDGRAEISDLYGNEDRPLFNRVVQGAYPTGSTWKIFMATAALNEGVITVENSRIQDGGLQIGNYFMSSLSHLGQPDIHLALVKSADGYFYRLGLKMGIEKIEHWTQVFHLGQRTGIDLPNERAGIPPSRAWKAKVNPRDPQWRDYDTAAAAIGQGIAITPLQMVRMMAGVSVGGRMSTPHCLLRVAAGYDRAGKWQPEMVYTDTQAFTVPMSAEVHETISQALWGVVNEAGTGGRARVEGFDVCGKTGTAQVASKRRAGEIHKDHAWFVSYAPRQNPELAAVVLVENAGFGGTHAAPVAKAIYETYYQQTRGHAPGTLTEMTLAKKQKGARPAHTWQRAPQRADEHAERAEVKP